MIPIVESGHWSLAVVYNAGGVTGEEGPAQSSTQSIAQSNSLSECEGGVPPPGPPCIFYMDSLSLRRPRLYRQIRAYVDDG